MSFSFPEFVVVPGTVATSADVGEPPSVVVDDGVEAATAVVAVVAGVVVVALASAGEGTADDGGVVVVGGSVEEGGEVPDLVFFGGFFFPPVEASSLHQRATDAAFTAVSEVESGRNSAWQPTRRMMVVVASLVCYVLLFLFLLL